MVVDCKVGVIGFGVMGLGIVKILCNYGYIVYVCDVCLGVVVDFVKEGGVVCVMFVEVVVGVDVVVLVVVNVVQIEVVLFGEGGVVVVM